MSTHKNIDIICVAVLIATVLLTVLFMNGKALGLTSVVDEDAESYEGDAYFTANDKNGSWSTDSATTITLNGDTATIRGNGAYTYGGSVYISGGGYYVVSGSLTGGSLVVDAYSSSKVWIMLDGVDIYRSDTAAFIVNEADKVFLTLAEGSVNTIACGDEFSDESVENNIRAAVYSKDDLTINGSGSLTIDAPYYHGIKCKDELVITGGDITITSAEDAMNINEDIRIMDASITIDAGDDGIHSDTAIYIASGTILINGCYEGIEAPNIDVVDGDITIYPTDDGFNANGGSDGFGMMGGGMGGGPGGNMGGFGGETDSESAEADGETAETDEAGEMPEMSEASEDERPDMSEMPEQADMTSGGGANESEDSDTDESEDEDIPYINISGGTITIINETGSDADGIDSNGDIIITGGDIRISLVNNGNNSALDYGSENGGVCEISGGTVVAAGNYSMAEQFDTSSEQCSILYTYSDGAEAGTAVALEDTDGNVILSYDVPCSFSSVNISCPEMVLGETYLVVIGDNVEEVTLEETSASYGDAASSMFGGTMNFGGMQSRSDFNGGGGFGRGGHGGFGRHSDSSESGDGDTESTDGERPEMPEDFDGEMPEGMELPEDFDGEMPDMSEMGEPPEMSEDFDGDMPDMSEMGEPPEMSEDFDGEMPDMSEMGDHGGMGMDGFGEDSSSEEETTVSTATSLSEFDADVWIYLGASVAVLVLGIAFVILYRKR